MKFARLAEMRNENVYLHLVYVSALFPAMLHSMYEYLSLLLEVKTCPWYVSVCLHEMILLWGGMYSLLLYVRASLPLVIDRLTKIQPMTKVTYRNMFKPDDWMCYRW